jgi:hypothetical protein
MSARRSGLAGAQADRDELGQQPVLADDAKRPVGRVHQPDRGLHDPPQGGLQVQPGADGDDRLEQAAHLVPGRQHGMQPRLQFTEKLVQPQLRKNLRPVSCAWLHQRILPR